MSDVSVSDEDFEPKNRKRTADSDDDWEAEPEKKKKKKKSKKTEKTPKKEVKVKKEAKTPKTPKKQSDVKAKVATPKKVKKEEPERWKWWEKDNKKQLPQGHHWAFLQHKGPVFAPEYVPLPDSVKFLYNGNEVKLTPESEEVMGFYARMLSHDYTTKDTFNKNFFEDWRAIMTHDEKKLITKLGKCDFRNVEAYYKEQSEIRKARSKEEKQKEKEEKEKIIEEFGYAIWDGHKEKIGNFNIEPPGLFRGRGEHPKMGKLKKRVTAKDIIINCSKDSEIPVPPPGQKWKEVRHDPSVTWLMGWTENVQGQNKYIMLNANSKIKGEKDLAKYEKARKLAKIIDRIRDNYKQDLKSKEMAVRQRAVAMYFIDKLALRAGNEKDSEETADTVGCCSLRVEHIKLKDKEGEKENIIVFDFLGKDSIRYYNEVPVEKRVFKNVGLFMENKDGDDDLFDRLDTSKLNSHLSDIMPGLTAKVFRTYNASKCLQDQLKLLTDEDHTMPEKVLSYNRANREVAVLCNHQRAAPKTFDAQMARMDEKIETKKQAIKEKRSEAKAAKAEYKRNKTEKNKKSYEQKKKAVERLEDQLHKLELNKTDKDENKTIALGTSKLNYLDPRISVAWCKKHDVAIEKVYNKTQRDKFQWAIDMIMGEEDEFVF